MSRVTFELPNHNTIIIEDNEARGSRGQLDAADTVVINGQVYNPAGAANQRGTPAWNYLLRVLQVPSLSGRNLQTSANIFRAREQAIEAVDSGNCERSDAILRDSNTLAGDNGMPLMSYQELGALVLPVDPTPVPDGGIAYLPHSLFLAALICAQQPRSFTLRTLQIEYAPLLFTVTPEMLRALQQSSQPQTPQRPPRINFIQRMIQAGDTNITPNHR